MRDDRTPHRTDRKRGARVRVAPGVFTRAGKFLVAYTDADGVDRMKTVRARNKTEAIAEREKLRVQVRAGEAVTPSRATYADVAQDYFMMFESLVRAEEKSPRTLDRYRQQYRSHLERPLGRLRIQAVRAEHLSRLLADLRGKGLGSWTVTGVYTLACTILNHAVSRGLITETPAKRLSKTEKPRGKNESEARVISLEEIGKLLGATPAPYRALVATAALTGARVSEVLGLRWQDVDFEARLVRIRFQLSRATRAEPAKLVRPKAGSRRDVELDAGLAKILRQHKLASRFSKPEDYVFTTSTGSPVYYRNASARGLDKAAETAGLNAAPDKPRFTFHDLRHSFITHLIRSGKDVLTVQRFAGHAKPSQTLDTYSHEFEARDRDGRSVLDGVFEGVVAT